MHPLHQPFPFDAAPASTIEQLKIVQYSPSLNGRHVASFGISTLQSHGSGWLRSDLDLQVLLPHICTMLHGSSFGASHKDI